MHGPSDTVTADDHHRLHLPSAPTPSATPAPRTYTVQPGDTLPAIAQRLYGHADKSARIAAANGLTGADPVAPGRQLVIPA
jgi:nucleoid-associated protein YgaU